MRVTIGPEGRDKSWQGEFPEVVPCAKCGSLALHAFTAHEGLVEEDKGLGIPRVGDLYLTQGEKGRLWAHDLVKNPHDGPSLCSVGMNVAGWSALDFSHTKEGEDHALLFRVRASIQKGGEKVSSPEVLASSLKTGKLWASVSLLAVLADAELPEWPLPKAPEKPQEAPKAAGGSDPSLNAVNALQEHAQAGKHPFPAYSFERAGGEDHNPQFTCTCTYLGRSATSPPDGNKKAAKKVAAHLVWGMIEC